MDWREYLKLILIDKLFQLDWKDLEEVFSILMEEYRVGSDSLEEDLWDEMSEKFWDACEEYRYNRIVEDMKETCNEYGLDCPGDCLAIGGEDIYYFYYDVCENIDKFNNEDVTRILTRFCDEINESVTFFKQYISYGYIRDEILIEMWLGDDKEEAINRILKNFDPIDILYAIYKIEDIIYDEKAIMKDLKEYIKDEKIVKKIFKSLY